MAQPTKIALQEQVKSLTLLLDAAHADNAALKAKLAEQVDLRDYVPRTEYNRVQGVLRTTLQFNRKYKARARSAAEPVVPDFRARCLAYFAATGARSVTAPQLREWEQAHAQ